MMKKSFCKGFRSGLFPVFCSIIAVFSLLLISCQSTKKNSGNLSRTAFYDENINSFFNVTLSNGVEVCFKDIPSEKNISLRFVFEGGIAENPGLPGIEKITLKMMSAKTKNYSEADIKSLSVKGGLFFTQKVSHDYVEYGFMSPASSFDEAAGIFVDTLCAPDFAESSFIKIVSREENASYAREENPKNVLLSAIYRFVYKNHPYKSGVEFDARKKISVKDTVRCYERLLNKSRIKIFCAGNISLLSENYAAPKNNRTLDAAKIVNEGAVCVLNKLVPFAEKFSSYSQNIGERDKATLIEIPEISLGTKSSARVPCEFTQEKGFAAICYACPSRGESDYEAFAVSTMIISSLLNRRLVEQFHVAENAGIGVLNGRKSLAVITVFNAMERAELFHMTEEAILAFPEEENIEKFLDSYKRIYLQQLEKSNQDALLSLDQMVSSYIYSPEKNPSDFLHRPEKILNLTAQDIHNAFKKYFVGAGESRILVADGELISDYDFE